MEVLEAVADYLQSKGHGITGALEDGIFVYSMPEGAGPAVLLLEPVEGFPIDHELPGYYRTSFQIVVRHKEHSAGRQLAREVSEELDLYNTTMSGVKFKYIRPRHEPFVFPVSKGDLLEFSVNFDTSFTI